VGSNVTTQIVPSLPPVLGNYEQSVNTATEGLTRS
jgi:hypothetical protein